MLTEMCMSVGQDANHLRAVSVLCLNEILKRFNNFVKNHQNEAQIEEEQDGAKPRVSSRKKVITDCQQSFICAVFSYKTEFDILRALSWLSHLFM